eukprot:g78174.t1
MFTPTQDARSGREDHIHPQGERSIAQTMLRPILNLVQAATKKAATKMPVSPGLPRTPRVSGSVSPPKAWSASTSRSDHLPRRTMSDNDSHFCESNGVLRPHKHKPLDSPPSMSELMRQAQHTVGQYANLTLPPGRTRMRSF